MKPAPRKAYFRNCTIKWVEFVREMKDTGAVFHRHFHTVEDALVIRTEGKKTIEYIVAYGVQYKHLKKRSKTLRFHGVEITKEKFDSIVREWKFEVAEAKEKLIIEQNGQINLDL